MRVFIAEDQFLLRQGLEQLLRAHGVTVAGSAESADGLVAAVGESGANLALLDIRMPPTNTDEGLRAARELRRQHPNFPVVLLSQYVEQLYLDELLADGADGVGYLLKDRVFDATQFLAALHTVAEGGTAVDPEVIAQLVARQPVQAALARLTSRETEVLALMARGDSNGSIAETLVVTERAVQKHINSIFTKLDLTESTSNARRVQAVLAFLRTPPPPIGIVTSHRPSTGYVFPTSSTRPGGSPDGPHRSAPVTQASPGRVARGRHPRSGAVSAAHPSAGPGGGTERPGDPGR